MTRFPRTSVLCSSADRRRPPPATRSRTTTRPTPRRSVAHSRSSGDVQANIDDFAWTLSADDAKQRWHLHLQGVLGRIRLADAGNRQGRPARGLLRDPGRARGPARPAPGARPVHRGGGSPASDARPYRLTSEEEAGTSGDSEPNDDAPHATVLGPDRLVAEGGSPSPMTAITTACTWTTGWRPAAGHQAGLAGRPAAAAVPLRRTGRGAGLPPG